MINKQQKKNQLLILAIFGLTIIPFLIAWGLKEYPGILKVGTNRDQLVIPPVPTERPDYIGLDNFCSKIIQELQGLWLVVMVIP